MKTSQRGLDDIIYSEGERLIAYRDRLTKAGGTYLDVWTIGVGHTSAAGPPEVTEGMSITHEQSREILSNDIAAVEARVLQAFKGKAPPQTVFDGAVSFDFNCGGILSASWVPLWLSGNMEDSEAHFELWNKPPEIIGRRNREADLIFRGKYHEPYVQPVGALPAQPAPPAAVASEVDVLAIQTKLAALGFYKGGLDGDRGPKTNAALEAFAISTLTKEGN